MEVALLESDGTVWGRNLPLTTQWQDVRVPLASFRHFPHWADNPPGRGGLGDKLQLRDLAGINVCFGTWLYPDHTAEPHTIEIESIEIE